MDKDNISAALNAEKVDWFSKDEISLSEVIFIRWQWNGKYMGIFPKLQWTKVR
jgi:hypothetical protein